MFTDIDFEGMFFPIHKEKLKDVKTLGLVPQFEDLDEDSIRYLIYMYDKNSPLAKRINSIDDRKDYACKLAGLSKKEDIVKITKLKGLDGKKLVETVSQMLKVQKSRVWGMICSLEQFFNESLYNMMEKIEMDKDKDILAALQIKAKIAEELEKTDERLESLYDRFYGDDSAVREKVVTISGYSPEKVAHVSGISKR